MNDVVEQGMVSIIIPVYNVAKYISETIQCVLNQTYKHFELLIIDDCSKDNTVEIVQNYALRDHRIRLIKQEINQGAAVARNKGIKESTGQYIAFLDSDDLWTDDKLERQICAMKENNYYFCYSSHDYIDENSKFLKKKIKIKKIFTYKNLLKKTMIATSTVIYDKTVFGNPLMPLRRTGQDYAFWFVLLRDANAIGITDALVHIRQRKGSLSKNKLQNIVDVWEVQTKNEKISKIYAIFNVFCYCIYAIMKKIF